MDDFDVALIIWLLMRAGLSPIGIFRFALELGAELGHESGHACAEAQQDRERVDAWLSN